MNRRVREGWKLERMLPLESTWAQLALTCTPVIWQIISDIELKSVNSRRSSQLDERSGNIDWSMRDKKIAGYHESVSQWTTLSRRRDNELFNSIITVRTGTSAVRQSTATSTNLLSSESPAFYYRTNHKITSHSLTAECRPTPVNQHFTRPITVSLQY